MKKVVFVYDDLVHKPKLHNPISFESSSLYEYEEYFVRKTKEILNVFIQIKIDVLILNVSFEDTEVFNLLKDVSKKADAHCKTIVISNSPNLRNMLFRCKIPERIFPSNVAIDILQSCIQELIDTSFMSDRSLSIKLINNFDLKPYSHSTQYFLSFIQVSISNPFLLGGHINNIFYSVSKINNVSYDTAKKGVYKVIELVRASQNTEYTRSFFGSNDINAYSPSEIIEKIVWKYRNKHPPA